MRVSHQVLVCMAWTAYHILFGIEFSFFELQYNHTGTFTVTTTTSIITVHRLLITYSCLVKFIWQIIKFISCVYGAGKSKRLRLHTATHWCLCWCCWLCEECWWYLQFHRKSTQHIPRKMWYRWPTFKLLFGLKAYQTRTAGACLQSQTMHIFIINGVFFLNINITL